MILPELVDGCTTSCLLCWNRNRQGSFKQMNLETVEKIISVFGRREKYYWYNWGEPLLYKNFHEFVEISKSVQTVISSSFSMILTDQHFDDLAQLNQIVISISGLTKNVYGVYHQKGNFDLVMDNIQKLKGYPKVYFNWISHPLNAHQEVAAKEFCREMGFIWGGLTPNCEVEDLIEGFEHPFLKKQEQYNNRGYECRIKKWIPISVDGEYLLCCASHNVGLGVTIWDNIDRNELMEIKSKMPLCKSCMEKELWKMF